MRTKRWAICLPILLTACADYRSEGRATAILDAAAREAPAHRGALVDGDIAEAQRTGLRLLTVLSVWEGPQ